MTTHEPQCTNEPDAETRALARSPVFDRLIAEARVSKAQGGVSLEQLDHELGITDRDKAIADAYLDALERLAAEQGAEVTDIQGHLLEVVLTAARHVRGEGTLAELAEYSGIPEAELRATAVGLHMAGLTAAPVAAAGPVAETTATNEPVRVEAR